MCNNCAYFIACKQYARVVTTWVYQITNLIKEANNMYQNVFLFMLHFIVEKQTQTGNAPKKLFNIKVRSIDDTVARGSWIWPNAD